MEIRILRMKEKKDRKYDAHQQRKLFILRGGWTDNFVDISKIVPKALINQYSLQICKQYKQFAFTVLIE